MYGDHLIHIHLSSIFYVLPDLLFKKCITEFGDVSDVVNGILDTRKRTVLKLLVVVIDLSAIVHYLSSHTLGAVW